MGPPRLVAKCSADALTNFPDGVEVQAAVLVSGSAHTIETDFRVPHRLRGVRGDLETSLRDGAGNQVREARLDNRASAPGHQLEFGRVWVDPDDQVTITGQASGGHRPDITHSENADSWRAWGGRGFSWDRAIEGRDPHVSIDRLRPIARSGRVRSSRRQTIAASRLAPAALALQREAVGRRRLPGEDPTAIARHGIPPHDRNAPKY